MRSVLAILLVTFPFFALVLCGYLAARLRWLPLEAIGGLNTFVLYFALPCMLYRFGATLPLAQLLDPAALAVYLSCALVVVAVVVHASRNPRIGWNDAAFGALVAAFPNTGFMGVPLLVTLLGQAAAGPVILTIGVDMVITSSLCIALSRLDGAAQHGVSAAVGRALKGVALNPMPWAIVLGGVSSATGWVPLKPVMQTVGLLADAASPVALFTIGAVLARAQRLSAHPIGAGADAALHRSYAPSTRYTPPTRWRDVVPVAAAKLVLHPLLVWLVGQAAMAAGLALSRFTWTVLVLVAALPSASNVSMLAERFGANTGRIARIVLLTTVVAFFSFSGAVATMKGASGNYSSTRQTIELN